MAYQTPGPRRRRRKPAVLAIVLGLAALGFLTIGALVFIVSLVDSAAGLGGKSAGGEAIGVIRLSGLIMSEDQATLFGSAGNGASSTVEHIREAAADDSIRAVVLRINSPGGSAAASQEIYEALMAARASKPFVASMADVAASGGYYAAAGCERIMANRATMTGSIGVIMHGYDLSGLYDWLKVAPQTIKSGKYKDIGATDRAMTADERRLLQAMIDNCYQQFLGDVARGRGVKVEAIKPIADGRIFTGEQARKAGLVDDLGGFWDAVKLAAKLGGLKDPEHARLEYYGGETLLDELLQTKAAPASPAAELMQKLGGGLGAGLWFVSPVSPPLLSTR